MVHLDRRASIKIEHHLWELFVCCGCLVAEDIGVHQLERLVELLTPKECGDLLFALSHREENIFQHIERLSPERNELNLKPIVKRDAAAAVGQ